MQTVDPDQEQPCTGWFTTDNYVKYQPAAADGSDCCGKKYVHPTYPDVALVIAIGVNDANFFLGLGTINSRGRVTHFGFFESDPVFAYGISGGTSEWKSFGGNDMTTSDRGRMKRQDQAIHLVFKYDSIGPGEIIQFDIAHVLNENDLFTAIASLKAIKISQPTGSVSGDNVLFSAVTNVSVSVVNFYLFAKKLSTSVTDWQLVGTTSTRAADGTYKIYFDSYLYADGTCQLKAVGTRSDVAGYIQTSIGSEIGNAGTVMLFTTSDSGGTFPFYTSVSTSLAMTKKVSSMVNPDSISYYREIYFAGEIISTLLLTTSTAPYTVSVSCSDLTVGVSVSVRARVKSNGGVYTTTTMFTGIVSRLNIQPTDITLSASSVNENSPNGVSVGVLKAVDADTDQVHTFTLLDSSTGRFSILGNTLAVNGPIDFESTKTLSVRVRVSDGQPSNCCFEKSFTITVKDVNEAPTSIAPTSFNVNENVVVGTTVGTVVATDPDVGQIVYYSFIGASAAFSVGLTTGVLKTAGSIDFETAASYELNLHVVDSGSPSLFLDRLITVSVRNLNDPPTALSLTCPVSLCSVTENVLIGTVVGTLLATDADVGDIQTYSLTGTAGGLFAVNPSTGVVTVAANVDYERLGFQVTITAKTTDSGGLSKTQDFSIVIVNVAEAPSSENTVCYVYEDRRVGETVTAVAGGSSLCYIDAASVDGTSIDFQIMDGASRTPGGKPDIYIQSCSGIFFINNTIDFESYTTYTMNIMVTTEGGVSYSTAVIHVVDVNEVPVFQDTTLNVNENVVAGTVFGSNLLSRVYDQDSLTSPTPSFCCELVFTIDSGNSAGFFSIADAATGQLQVALNGLNFETQTQFKLTLKVTDKGGLSDLAEVTVLINNVNENPRLTFSSGVFSSIAENTIAGTTTGIGIYASDEDVGQIVTVAITSGNIGGAFGLAVTYDASFGINKYQFIVSNSAALDYEAIADGLMILTLTATDNGSPILTSTQTYTIMVTDVNEAPTLSTPPAFYINENSAQGTSVGTMLSAYWSDPDLIDTTLFTITNYHGDNAKMFGIDSETGALFLSQTYLSFETQASYTYSVRVTDKGGLTASTTVVINVNDLPEAPNFAVLSLGTVDENIPRSNQIFVSNAGQDVLYRATDDDGDILTFAVLNVDGSSLNAHWFVPYQSGSNLSTFIIANRTFNYEIKNSYQLYLSVTDGTFFDYAYAQVAINDVNDSPTVSSTQTCYIASDAAVGVEICTVVGQDEDFTSGSSWGQLTYSFISTYAGLTIRTNNNVGTIIMSDDVFVDNPSTVVSVVVTDGGNLNVTCDVTIIVITANKAPTCPSVPLVYNLNENSVGGTIVGTITGSDSATKITDENYAVTVVLIAGNTNSHFNLNSNTGVLSVSTGAIINFEVLTSYTLAVRVTEVAAEPLTSTCNVDIVVVDVNEPTTFGAQTFTVDENIFPGPLTRASTVVSNVKVIDEDPADQNGIFSLTCVSCKDDPIAINGTTGALSLKFEKSLNFEVFPVYTYTCNWNSRGVSKSASLTINLADVSETPVVQKSTFSIVETKTIVTVGQVNAVDPDYEGSIDFSTNSCRDNCGLKYYIQSGTPNIGGFSIDINTGIMSVSAVDFENDYNFSFVIKVVDSSGLANTEKVWVMVTDASDCSADTIANSTGNLFMNAYTGGGEDFIVFGTNYGPTESRMSRQGILPSAVTVSAHLQSASTAAASSFRYALTCSVDYTGIQDNTMLACKTPAGVGTGLGIVATITAVYPGGYTSVCTTPFSSSRMSYAPPVITSISNAEAVRTDGTTTVQITGLNFGRGLVSIVQATFSNAYITRTVSCSILVEQTQVSCPTSTGFGSDLAWTVVVGSQRSDLYYGGSYAVPSITSVSTMLIDTLGGDNFNIIGLNFGNSKDRVVVTYGPTTGFEYTALSCSFVSQHFELSCKTVEGVGKSLKVVVQVGDLTSAVYSGGDFSYRAPILTTVTGPGSNQGSTEGGDIIYLRGSQFGPVSLNPDMIVVKYGKLSEPNRYTANDCKVTTKSTRIECVTVPGTGVGLAWSVVIADQDSGVLDAQTSYGAPIVTDYSGEGSLEALTVGNETIYIAGKNFGATISAVERVSYSSDNGTLFVTTHTCVMYEPHVKIKCQTVPGAGSSLSWSVKVDGQNSVSPTTSYSVPSISTISGGNVLNGSVYGREVFRIFGANFGPANAFDLYKVNFLERVTYGTSGVEYEAEDCIVESDSEISCTSVQGVGGNLVFRVTVAGQDSSTSSAIFSYAAPKLTSISPASITTAGTTKMTLRGENFATFSLPPLFFGGVEVVATYITETQIEFIAPEVLAVESITASALLVVGGQLSNTLSVSYQPPLIQSVSTIDGSNGTLYLIIEGSSFSLNPEVLVYDAESSFFSFASCYFKNHNEVNCITTAKKGNVTIIAGPQSSNVGYFEFGPPRVLSKTLAGGTARTIGYTASNPAVLTVTGQNFGEASSNAYVFFENRNSGNISLCETISFKKIDKTADASEWAVIAASVSGEDPTLGFEQITCELPEGQGVNNSVKVSRSSSISLGCGCNGCNVASCFAYLSPELDTMTVAGGSTQGGYQVTFTGDNFGTEKTVTVGGVSWSLDGALSSHTQIVANVPAGEGKDLLVVVIVDNQMSTSTVSETRRQLADSNIYFSYSPPVITTFLEPIVVGTDGSVAPISISGSNFGVEGPVVRLGGELVEVISFTHTEIIFYIPPGQGKDLVLSVDVSDQIGYSPDMLSYLPPSITAISPLSCDTSGGRVTGVTMTMDGSNFGFVDKQWVLSFGAVTVPEADIITFSSTQIIFYAPEGQGWELPISIDVSGQANTGTTFLFNYNPPEIDYLTLPTDVNTRGGYLMSFTGRSFGVSGAIITIEDPLYSEDSLVYRMPPTECSLLSQQHTMVECTVPPGAGDDLIVVLQIGDKIENSVAFNFSYSPPVIAYFYQSNGGDASGSERLKVYGSNFGAFRTDLNISIGGVLCPKAVWLADDPVYRFQPYLQCETPRMPVGVKNVTVSVAFQESNAVDTYRISCKAGTFGGTGEYCTDCGDSELTGMVCETDNLYTPYAHDGFYMEYKTVPSGDCSDESQVLRSICPASLPCMPKEACLGNNTCDTPYVGSRCANCAEGYYKINGECQPCPDTPWIIPLVICIFIIAATYIA